jgi:hypothetical protein
VIGNFLITNTEIGSRKVVVRGRGSSGSEEMKGNNDTDYRGK